MFRAQLRKRIKSYLMMVIIMILIVVPVSIFAILQLPDEVKVVPIIALLVFAGTLVLATVVLHGYSRLHTVEVLEDQMKISRFLGLGKTHLIPFNQIQSCKLVREHPTAGFAKMIVLRNEAGHKFKLSASVYRNYREMNELIVQKVPGGCIEEIT